MAINFPDSPVDGQEVTLANTSWMYSTSKSAWLRTSRGVTVDGLKVYNTISDLPLSGLTAGQQAFISSSNTYYISNGSGWYSVTLVNTSPSITAVQDASANTTPFTLNTDGSTTVITVTATDPEDTPLIYSYSVTSGSLNGTTITQSSNVFTITPHASNATTFELTFTASDGVNTATSGVNSFSLTFIVVVPDSHTTSLLIKALDTGSNKVLVDSSSNNRSFTYSTIPPVYTAWNPSHPKGQAFYNDNTDYVQTGVASTDFTFDGDFCIEGWVYHLSAPTNSTFYFGTRENNLSGVTIRTSFVSPYSVSFDYGINPSDTVTNDRRGSTTLSVRQWHHLALTRDNGTMRLFVDGVLESTFTSAATYGVAGGSKFSINMNPNSSTGSFVGWQNNIRVVKGYPVYTSAFTPSREPLENIVGTVYLKNNYSYNGVDYSGATKEMYPPNNSYRTDRARAWSPFNTLEYDNSQHYGSISFGDGNANYAIVDMSDVTIGTGDYTFECWFYYNAQPNDMSIFEGGALRFLLSPGGQLTIVDSTGSVTSDAQPPTGFDKLRHTWVHCAVVRNSGTLKMYKNGTEVKSVANTTNIAALSSSTYIGQGTGLNTRWPGNIYDFKFSGAAKYTANFTPSLAPVDSTDAHLHLKGTEVKIADTAAGLPILPYNTTEASTAQTKFNTYSMSFNSANSDYIKIGTVYDTAFSAWNIGTEDFTIEMWAYFNDFAAARPLLSGWVTGGTTAIQALASTGRLDAYTGGAWRYGSALAANQWHHIAFYRNSGTSYLAANGSSLVSFSDTNSYVYTSGNTYLGRWSNSYMNGYIEDFRVTVGASRYSGASYTVPTEAFKG